MKDDGSTAYQAYILNDDTGEMFPAFDEDFKTKEALDEAFIQTLPADKQEICNQINRRTEFKVVKTTYKLY